MTYRRVFLQDSTDVFEERKKRAQLEAERVKVKTGPPPFSAAMGQATAALAALSSQGVWVDGWPFQLQRLPLGKKRGTATT